MLQPLAPFSKAVFCPVCNAEYREGYTRCAECGAELVATMPELPGHEERDELLVRLWRGADPVLYSALTAALNSAGIPFFDNPPRDHENWLSAREHTGFGVGVPNFDIHVPRSHFEAARGILLDLLNSNSGGEIPETLA